MSERWEQVESLFVMALELPPGERDHFLAEACAGQPALREEVDSLLLADAASAAGEFLDTPIAQALGQLHVEAEGSRVGQVVGPYRLTGELGHGGMGRVYRAERVDDQYRAEVAIKFVQGALANPGLVARFRAERQILADLTHPNIARLLDGGTAPDGTPFLVMERIAGQPIDRFCDDHDLGLRARLQLFVRVCRAVEYAHQSLVVHRDLKPSNILVTEGGEPKLLDFGIAKLVEPGEEEEESTLLRALTPAYASPEQVRGQRVTVASDVYSLGVVLYRLLAGREPHRLRGLSPGEVERVLAEVEPERLGAAARRGNLPWAAALAGDLETIVQKALGKAPGDRYPTVVALREDLERHLEGRPVRARPATPWYRAGKFARRYWRELTVAGVALAAVVVLSGWYLHRLAGERDRARLEAAKAAEVAGFLQHLFEVSDPAEARGESITARELLDSAALRVDRELAGQPSVQATMLRVIGSVYASLGLPGRGRPLLERALATHRALHEAPHAELATSQIALGTTLQDLGLVDSAGPLLADALAQRRALHGPVHAEVSEAAGHLAYLRKTVGDYAAAESLWTEALRVDRLVYPPGAPRITKDLVELGGLLRRLKRLTEAEPLLREGLTAQRALFGEMSLPVAATERNLAALLRDRGAFAESDSLYQRVLATRKRLLGETHPDYAITLNSYALLLQEMGDTVRVVATFDEALRVLQRAYPGPHPSVAAAFNNRGYAELELGHYADALESFRASQAIQARVLAPGHVNRSHTMVGLGLVRLRQERFAEAERHFRRALAIREAALPAGHRDIGEALSDLGAALAGQRRYAAAESALARAQTLLLAADGPDGYRTVRVTRRLAALHDAWSAPDAPVDTRLPAALPARP